MSQSTELLPCPFCGASSHRFKVNPSVDNVGRWMKLECTQCYGSTQDLHFYEDDPELRDHLRAFWNSRAIASVKREPLSDEQITELDLPGMMYVDIVRKIEEAHGIK